MAELYRRKIRIECDPKMSVGSTVKISDADTGEAIPGVFKATVHLDVAETNTADLVYWETKENGAVCVGPDDEPIIHEGTVEHPEVDITAFERSQMDLGNGLSVTALPNDVVGESYMSIHLVDVAAHLRLTPVQALALLSWLKVSEKDLQQAAEHHNRPPRRTLARVEEA